jgi:hypothetical protein
VSAVPPLTRAEVSDRHREEPRPANCPECRSGYPVRHWPSAVCRSSFRRDDTGTERVFRVHCTCDYCF